MRHQTNELNQSLKLPPIHITTVGNKYEAIALFSDIFWYLMLVPLLVLLVVDTVLVVILIVLLSGDESVKNVLGSVSLRTSLLVTVVEDVSTSVLLVVLATSVITIGISGLPPKITGGSESPDPSK